MFPLSLTCESLSSLIHASIIFHLPISGERYISREQPISNDFWFLNYIGFTSGMGKLCFSSSLSVLYSPFSKFSLLLPPYFFILLSLSFKDFVLQALCSSSFYIFFCGASISMTLSSLPSSSLFFLVLFYCVLDMCSILCFVLFCFVNCVSKILFCEHNIHHIFIFLSSIPWLSSLFSCSLLFPP